METTSIKKSAFRDVPFKGVIWAVAEAKKRGFYSGNPEWANLGQGQPEVGEIEGAAPRITSFSIDESDQEYGPFEGTLALRKSVADYYNRLYRKDKSSKYTEDNVSIAMGGRLVLSRIFASLGEVRLGYKNPDYTVYQELMTNYQRKIYPIELQTNPENGYCIPAKDLNGLIVNNKLDAFLFSNPCNPTGKVIQGEDLNTYVQIAVKNQCALIIDEAYSQYIYDGDQPAQSGVSAARYVENVNEDPIIILDALTKSFRYPGWRLAWVIGPSDVISNINRAASTIDGGASLPIQKAAIEILSENRAEKDTQSLRKKFSQKRALMIDRLSKCGINCDDSSNGTFYVWGDISQLPPPLNNALEFFYKALEKKVITLPGSFFHIKTGVENSQSKFESFVRFSYGPSEVILSRGLDRLTEMINNYKK